VIRRLTRSTWLRLALTAAILAYLASQLDMREAGRSLVRIDPWYLLAALALVAVDRVVMVLRWVVLLRGSAANVPLRSATWIFLVSSFVGSFLPAGVGADATRAYVLGRRTERGAHALASVAVDRLLGLASIVLLGSAGIVLWTGRMDPDMQRIATAGAALALVATAATLFADKIVRSALPVRWHASRSGARLVSLGEAVAAYRRRPAALTGVLALSLGVQVLRVLQAWLLGIGLGIGVEFVYYLVFMPIGLLVLLLPVSISGFGLPQGVIVWLLSLEGVAAADSFALSTLIVLTGVAGNLPGALLYLRSRTS
jgi:glycosyltransferase 2 family protein